MVVAAPIPGLNRRIAFTVSVVMFRGMRNEQEISALGSRLLDLAAELRDMIVS